MYRSITCTVKHLIHLLFNVSTSTSVEKVGYSMLVSVLIKIMFLLDLQYYVFMLGWKRSALPIKLEVRLFQT